jgi:hypothetical protein
MAIYGHLVGCCIVVLRISLDEVELRSKIFQFHSLVIEFRLMFLRQPIRTKPLKDEVVPIRTLVLVMTVRFILSLRDGIEAMLPHDPPYLPLADRDAGDTKFPRNLPAPVGVVAPMEAASICWTSSCS